LPAAVVFKRLSRGDHRACVIREIDSLNGKLPFAAKGIHMRLNLPSQTVRVFKQRLRQSARCRSSFGRPTCGFFGKTTVLRNELAKAFRVNEWWITKTHPTSLSSLCH
jgi:hypothetical protein